MTRLAFLLTLLAFVFTGFGESYVPEEGSAELLKRKKQKIPYDSKLPNVFDYW